MSTGEKGGTAESDELLSELLDSALGDFKTSNSPKTESTQTKTAACSVKAKAAPPDGLGSARKTGKAKKETAASSSRPQESDDDLANMARMFGGLTSVMGGGTGGETMEAQFGTLMQLLKQEDPTLFDKFSKLNERATNLDDESSEAEFANILQDTLEYLNDGLKEDQDVSPSRSGANVQGPGAGPGPGPGLGSASGDDAERAPIGNLEQFVDSAAEMMRSVLSRSVFYPLIKSLTARYPAWIAAQRERAQLTAAELEKHEKQCAALSRIRVVYERSSEQSELLNAADLQLVIELLREAQSFGDPPRELLDEGGSSAIDTLGRQCVVM